MKYSFCEEAKDIATAIVKHYPKQLESVDLKGIAFVRVEKKPPRGKINPAAIQSVRGVYKLLCEQYTFVILVYSESWDELSDNHKRLTIYHELLHIDEEGKLRDHTVQDFKVIVDKFGTDWLSNPNIPNILERG